MYEKRRDKESSDARARLTEIDRRLQFIDEVTGNDAKSLDETSRIQTTCLYFSALRSPRERTTFSLPNVATWRRCF